MSDDWVSVTELLQWAEQRLALSKGSLTGTLVAGDASPRRYYRLMSVPAEGSRTTLMGVISPASEGNSAFIQIRNLMDEGGIRVPALLASDLERGFLLLEDLGDDTLLPLLSDHSAGAWYAKAFHTLLRLTAMSPGTVNLPEYDVALLQRELLLFRDWFVQPLLGCAWCTQATRVYDRLCQRLIDEALTQPRVVVHRDYHSRNLMCLADGELAVIDFQDAVIGPVTYDAVSLLKDCYIAWPRARQLAWLEDYRCHLQMQGRIDPGDAETFVKWFDLMGLQRHLKVLGIFARLALRDDKPGYLADLPLVVAYVEEVLSLYATKEPVLAEFYAWFNDLVAPKVRAAVWYRKVQRS